MKKSLLQLCSVIIKMPPARDEGMMLFFFFVHIILLAYRKEAVLREHTVTIAAGTFSTILLFLFIILCQPFECEQNTNFVAVVAKQSRDCFFLCRIQSVICAQYTRRYS